MDGRDIGTFVLPKADVKIYLTASVEERAKRRCLELEEKGIPADLEKIKEDIRTRDHQDMNRSIAPLKRQRMRLLWTVQSCLFRKCGTVLLMHFRNH